MRFHYLLISSKNAFSGVFFIDILSWCRTAQK